MLTIQYSSLLEWRLETYLNKKTAHELVLLALAMLVGGTILFICGKNYWYKRKVNDIKSHPFPKMKNNLLPITQKKPSRPSATFEKSSESQSPPSIYDQEKVLRVKQKHKEQIEQFEQWAKLGQWSLFETSHYDWWVFPISRSSAGHGEAYAVGLQEIHALKKDAEFMQFYRRGVELVLQSWGWDSQTGLPLSNKAPEQRWINYGVRLGKMADSLQLFGEERLFQQAQKFTETCADIDQLEKWVKNNLKLDKC